MTKRRLRDQDLAEHPRGGEDHLGEAQDAEEADVELALVAGEAGRDDRHRLLGEDEHDRHRERHDQDRQGQDRPGELASLGRFLALEPDEQRQERADDAADDQEVEGQLGKAHRRGPGVELRSGSVAGDRGLAG